MPTAPRQRIAPTLAQTARVTIAKDYVSNDITPHVILVARDFVSWFVSWCKIFVVVERSVIVVVSSDSCSMSFNV